MVQPRLRGHPAVVFHMVSWQTTLITEINMHARPVNTGDVCQYVVHAPRGGAARQRHMYLATIDSRA